MKHLKFALCLLGIFAFTAVKADPSDYKDVFALLDLDRPGLEKVKTSCNKKQWERASEELLKYYRNRQDVYIPGQDATAASDKDILWANDALKHTFHVLDKPVWNYGKKINWQYWPVKDIEMRLQLHRQGWWTPLGKAYRTTRKAKYAREYVFEFRDWIKKNPYKPITVKQGDNVSSGTIDVNAPNECFAWRPLEIGIRLLRWTNHFVLFSNSDSFTPEFLLQFLKSYHENAAVLMQNFSPSGNHLVHQSYGILRAGICFPEFKDAESWVKAGADNLNKEISNQTLADGCHFELDPAYHMGFVDSFDSAVQLAEKNGKSGLFPKENLEKLAQMACYYLDYCYPDLTHPCFSDARRHEDLADRDILEHIGRSSDSKEARQVLRFATEGKEGDAPAYKSSGHPASGFYTFRDGWADAKIIMPVKATERGMWHAQPDFGTFELWAYGKILMPDAGSFTYSGSEDIERDRAYFKATARHNAITLGDKDYKDPKPEVIAWKPVAENGVQLLNVKHEAYDGLTRRRCIAFIDEKFFVVVDEVSGSAAGKLTLRNCLGSGSVRLAPTNGFIYNDGDAGLRILVAGPNGSAISTGKDWYSEAMHEKSEREVICLDVPRAQGEGVQRFVTILCPFTGEKVPEVTMKGFSYVNVDGKDYKIDF